MAEAIILAGGNSDRMKPQIDFNKALLPIKDITLLEYQTQWLCKHGFNHVICAISEDVEAFFRDHMFHSELDTMVDLSVESKKLGTSGAVFRACDYSTESNIYIMNVDDILLDMYPRSLESNTVVLSRPLLGFGVCRLKNGLVTRFQEKPTLKFWTSAGHYALKKETIRDYFYPEGSLETLVLPQLAKDRKLRGFKYSGRWLTMNTWKDYLNFKETMQ